MTDKEMVKEFNNFLKEKNISFKPNPNHYPIIDKWNLKAGNDTNAFMRFIYMNPSPL